MPIYGGLIWTNHALERLKERKIPQDYALQTFRSPSAVFDGKQKGTKEYQRFFSNHLITIIATKNDKHEDVILSCWAEPPFAGSTDIQKKKDYREYQKAGILKRIWLDIRSLFRI